MQRAAADRAAGEIDHAGGVVEDERAAGVHQRAGDVDDAVAAGSVEIAEARERAGEIERAGVDYLEQPKGIVRGASQGQRAGVGAQYAATLIADVGRGDRLAAVGLDRRLVGDREKALAEGAATGAEALHGEATGERERVTAGLARDGVAAFELNGPRTVVGLGGVGDERAVAEQVQRVAGGDRQTTAGEQGETVGHGEVHVQRHTVQCAVGQQRETPGPQLAQRRGTDRAAIESRGKGDIEIDNAAGEVDRTAAVDVGVRRCAATCIAQCQVAAARRD